MADFATLLQRYRAGDLPSTELLPVADRRLQERSIDCRRPREILAEESRKLPLRDHAAHQRRFASGFGLGHVATQLAVSIETVRAYLESIRAKLGAKTRTAIVSIAHGLHAEGVNGSG